MENHTSPLKNSANTEPMYDFFHTEFQSLRAKTGIRQWEQLNEQPDSAKLIHDVIDFMCKECSKPPFDVVRPVVKQRVISRAIVEDDDFIGMNAKFVRRALNAWWKVNGDRVIEAMNEGKVIERVELTAEQKRKIDHLANKYVSELLQGDGPRTVPHMKRETAEKEGAEWTSNIERKAINYPMSTSETAEKHLLHLEYVRQNFDIYTAEKLPTWIPESEWLANLKK